MTKEEIKQWLLENCVNEYGVLDLSELDFSDFDGDVNISYMTVKCDLFQERHTVKGDLYQTSQEVEGNLIQSGQIVKGDLIQHQSTVKGDLFQNNQTVKGDLFQGFQKVGKGLDQQNNEVKGRILRDEDDAEVYRQRIQQLVNEIDDPEDIRCIHHFTRCLWAKQ